MSNSDSKWDGSWELPDGDKVTNIEITGKSAACILERFVAHALNLSGVKSIGEYETRRNIGTGELFNKDGHSLGQIPVYGRGFQKKIKPKV